MSKSRLFVFQLKEIVYTVLFIILGIILVIVVFNMFKGSKKEETTTDVSYVPGIYSTQLNLNNQNVNLEVVVDESSITSVSVTNLSDTLEVMYPLLQPSIEYIQTELQKGTPLSDIQCDKDSQYTQTMLIDSISSLLNTAAVK